MTWLRWLWDRYEWLFAFTLGIRPIAPGSMLRVREIIYRGQPLRAQGAPAIRPGMRVLELHLDNRRIGGLAGVQAQGSTGTEVAFRLRRRLREELPLLLRTARGWPRPVAGVVGTSLLAIGARGLGFHVEPLPPGLGDRWLAAYMRWLGKLYRVSGSGGHGRQKPGQGRQPGQRGQGGQRGQRAKLYITWVTAAELERLVTRAAESPAAPH